MVQNAPNSVWSELTAHRIDTQLNPPVVNVAGLQEPATLHSKTVRFNPSKELLGVNSFLPGAARTWYSRSSREPSENLCSLRVKGNWKMN